MLYILYIIFKGENSILIKHLFENIDRLPGGYSKLLRGRT